MGGHRRRNTAGGKGSENEDPVVPAVNDHSVSQGMRVFFGYLKNKFN